MFILLSANDCMSRLHDVTTVEFAMKQLLACQLKIFGFVLHPQNNM